MLYSYNVILKGSKIIEVGQNIAIPQDADIYTGDDLTLLPGLMDSYDSTSWSLQISGNIDPSSPQPWSGAAFTCQQVQTYRD